MPNGMADIPAEVTEADSLPLHAERFHVSRRRVEMERVRATRTTRTRQAKVDELLTHTRVEVQRVPINRLVDAMPPVRHEGDTTIFPVVEEVVVTEIRLLLKEEVHLKHVQTSGRHVQTVEVREQQVEVSRTRLALPSRGNEAQTEAHVFQPSPESTDQMSTTSTTDETIVAVFETTAQAEAAVSELKAAGVPASAISQHAGAGAGTMSAGSATPMAAPVREQGFWASLFGGEPDHDTTVYDRSLDSGSTVVTVKAPGAHVTSVLDILESHNPIDIDERASGYGLSQTATTGAAMGTTTGTTMGATTGTTGSAMGSADTIKLTEERLAVGKRLINRGGTRIRRFVVETPIEEQVTLHDEKVTLERRPVTDGRPVTDADFSEKTIEMTETAEEAVIAKQAFVTEEIALRKQASERVQTVRDTVRREDVEIEQIPGEAVSTTSTTGPVTPVTPVKPKI